MRWQRLGTVVRGCRFVWAWESSRVDIHTPNILSLCSGGGGLDLGVKLALDGGRTICWVEWEAFAIAQLVASMEAGALDEAPIWSDVKTFDGKPWRGIVDILTAGYPCQPFSTAGKRRGSDDPRHLWPYIARIVSEVKPPVLFFENVPGHITLGFSEVAAECERMGYTVAVDFFSAEEVGATHPRERLFILGCKRGFMADSDGEGLSRPPLFKTGGNQCGGLPIRSISKLRSMSFPPPPSDFRRWEQIASEDPASFPLECGVHRLVDGVSAYRPEWVRLFGNGVCPLVGAYAFATLWGVLRLGG